MDISHQTPTGDGRKFDYHSGVKRFGSGGLILAVLFLLSACASHEILPDESSSRAAAPVPGETVPDSGMGAAAGPGTVGAGARW